MSGKKTHLLFLCGLIITFLVSSHCLSEIKDKPGILISKPAKNHDGVIKILLYYDMEGVSGQNDMRSLSHRNPEYIPIRKNLTLDVNAVIDGLFAGGAKVVDVVDAHGSGNPEPDILLDQMDSRAQLIFKDKPFRPYCDLTQKDLYDAVVVVCMHSKTGGEGFAAHTYTIGMDWILNEMSINETEIIAYSWGRVDVPVIFASGDDKLKEQLEYLDWIEYVTVKFAKGATDANLRPLYEVHQEMRAKAKKAVENLAKAKAVRFKTPIKAQLRAVHPASLKILKGVPGINYINNTVSFEAATYQEAYDGITALIRVATNGYTSLLREAVRESKEAGSIFDKYVIKLFTRWGEVESGRWKPSPPEKSTTTRKYFGAR
jgi:D-amino peptidase